MRRILLAASTLILIVLAYAVHPVSAHANLVRSEPAAGAVLDTPPDTVKLWFSEVPESTFSQVQLFDRAGNAIAGVGPLRVDASDSTLLMAQLPALKPGIYTVSWRTASAVDGHVTAGGFAFVIGRDQVPAGGLAPQLPGNSTGTGDVPVVASVIRWASYVALALLVGGFAFAPLIFYPALTAVPAEERKTALAAAEFFYRQLVAGWLLLVATTVAAALQEALNTGTDLLNLLTTTRFGVLFGLRIGLLLALGIVLTLRRSRQPTCRWWYAGLVLNGVLLVIISLNSHAAALPQPLFPVIADVLHVAAMSVWLGGLLAMLFTLRRSRHSGASVRFSLTLVSRFSDVAMLCVATLGLTGVIQVFFQVGDLHNLTDTPYGLALSAKLLLLVPLLSLGAVNLLVTRRKIAAAINAVLSDGTFPRPVWLIMRSVSTEIGLIVVVLAATGVLTNLPPAREAFGSGAVVRGQAGDLSIVVAANPGLPGLNTLDIYLKDDLNRPISGVEKVAVIFGMLEHDMGQQEATAVQVADGHYVVQGSYVSMIGTWQLGILVRRSGMDDVKTTLTLPVLALKQPPTSRVLLAPSRAEAALAIAAASLLMFVSAWRLRRRRRRVLLVAGGLALVVGLAVGATAFGSGMTAILIAENPVPPDVASLQRGQQIYKDNCLACHGDTGAGDGPVGVSLTPRPTDLRIPLKAKYTDGQLFDLLTRGIPGSTMTGFGMTLSDQDRWDIINTIEAFGSGR